MQLTCRAWEIIKPSRLTQWFLPTWILCLLCYSEWFKTKAEVVLSMHSGRIPFASDNFRVCIKALQWKSACSCLNVFIQASSFDSGSSACLIDLFLWCYSPVRMCALVQLGGHLMVLWVFKWPWVLKTQTGNALHMGRHWLKKCFYRFWWKSMPHGGCLILKQGDFIITVPIHYG